VSFGAPAALFGLLGVPVLVALYVASRRLGSADERGLASPLLLDSVLPRRPRWRRHVPLAVMLLALAALVVAAARPQRSVAVVVERATIVLATDVSGSMLATDIAPNRLAAAQRAARAFVGSVPKKVNVGVMAFNQAPQVLQSPTTDRAAIDRAIGGMKVSGGTASGEAVLAALRTLGTRSGAAGTRPPAAIVLLSDGASTGGADPVAAARQAARQHVPIYTVALGTPQGTISVKRANGRGTYVVHVPPDPATLRRMAAVSGGSAFSVADAPRLDQIYRRLGSQLGRVHRTHQVTVYFAGGGLLLLLTGAAMSLRWFGRLI
jgi:Ca-activated chloride channel family protein